MSQQLPAVLKNKYFYLLLFLGVFTLIMNANAIAAQIFYCNIVLGNPGFMSTLMGAGQLPGLIIMFFMPALMKKLSKRGFMVMGAVLMILGFAICGVAGSNTAEL